MAKMLGDKTEVWFKDLEGLQINNEGLAEWKDFSDPMQVTFGYPERKDTYSIIFPTQVDSGLSSDIKIFLFLELADHTIKNLSYSVIAIDFDGAGTNMKTGLLEPDIAVLENIMFITIADQDHPRLQDVIDNRLRKLPRSELVMAKQFFTQVYNNPTQQAKYGKIIDEKKY